MVEVLSKYTGKCGPETFHVRPRPFIMWNCRNFNHKCYCMFYYNCDLEINSLSFQDQLPLLEVPISHVNQDRDRTLELSTT